MGLRSALLLNIPASEGADLIQDGFLLVLTGVKVDVGTTGVLVTAGVCAACTDASYKIEAAFTSRVRGTDLSWLDEVESINRSGVDG